MKQSVLARMILVVLALTLAVACTREIVKEVPVTEVVTQEVVREVPVEKIVEVEKETIRTVEVEKPVEVVKEVIKEIEVPGETVVVEKEVVREVTVPGETVVVEKEVVREVPKEVVVEKEVVRIVEKIVEVPVPAKFSEAPSLTTLVQARELPPVKQRLPEVPMVIPANEIGVYGGTWTRAFTSANDRWGPYSTFGPGAVVRASRDGTRLVPGLAQSYESTPDGKEWTFHLRKGIRWSDGAPFTVDDFVFAFEDKFKNLDLFPGGPPTSLKSADGNPAELVKLDDYTMKFVFTSPNYRFDWAMVQLDIPHFTAIFEPAHFLKQFHIKYNADADNQAKAAGFDSWVQWFADRNYIFTSTERPSIRPWALSSNIQQQNMIAERNPYFYGTDQKGNQLPYIDRIVYELTNPAAVPLKAMAGELDFMTGWLNFTELPVLQAEAAETGLFRTIIGNSFGSHEGLNFNQNSEGSEAVWVKNADFRRALSHAIDRVEINQLENYGLGRLRGPVPPRGHPQYPGDEYATKYLAFDQAEANRLLDSIGLDQKDADGNRIDPNTGETLTIVVDYHQDQQRWQIIADMWTDVGVKTVANKVTRTLVETRCNANDWLVNFSGFSTTFFWTGWGKTLIPIEFPGGCGGSFPLYGQWYQTNGEEGVEPPQEIKDLQDLYAMGAAAPVAEANEIAKEFFKFLADGQYYVTVFADGPGVAVATPRFSNLQPYAVSFGAMRSPHNAFPEQFFLRP